MRGSLLFTVLSAACLGVLVLSRIDSSTLAQTPTTESLARSQAAEEMREVLYKNAVSKDPIDLVPWSGARFTLTRLSGKHDLELKDNAPEITVSITGPFLFHPKYPAYDDDGNIKDMKLAASDVIEESLWLNQHYYQQVGMRAGSVKVGGDDYKKYAYVLLLLEGKPKKEGDPVAKYVGTVVDNLSGTAIVFEGQTTKPDDIKVAWRNFRQLVESASDEYR